jgi:hypothetical protein
LFTRLRREKAIERVSGEPASRVEPKRTSFEQYYLDLLNPKYNILKKAGSLLGFKHSRETIAKMKNRNLTGEHKAKPLGHPGNLHGNAEYQLKRLKN